MRASRKWMKTFSSNSHKSNCKFEHVTPPGIRLRILVTADLTKIVYLCESEVAGMLF